MKRNSIYSDIGRIGQNRSAGRFYEEFLPELRGYKGIQVYKEMSSNDDVVGAILYAIETLVRQAHFSVAPQGNKKIDRECAEFVESCLYDLTDCTFTDTVSEILTFLIYGWSAHEIVYKRRMGRKADARLNSKHNDGLIGWKGFPIRGQETLVEWLYDDDDNILGLRQCPPPKYQMIDIPIDRLLLFKTKSRKGNPEGVSILRNAYRSWYFKKRIQEIEGIGIERDLAGLPVIQPPEGVDIWNDDDPDMIKCRKMAETVVSSIKRDENEGVVLPYGWTIELLSSAGQRQFDTNAVIERYDTRIAMTVLADFVLLGHQNVGSFALSSDKTELFGAAIGSYLNIICEVFNKDAIPKLIELNAEHFKGITDYPCLEHGDIENVDLSKLGEFLKTTVSIGAITPDGDLEDYLRDAAGLPEKLNGLDMPKENLGSKITQENQESLGKSFTHYTENDIIKYSPDQPRDENGRWTDSGGSGNNVSMKAELLQRIKNGQISTKIDNKKQNKHIEGTKEYEKAIKAGGHPSRMIISKEEQQALVDRYTTEGMVKMFKDGSIRVEFTHDKTIGICCSEDGRLEQKTNKGTIHCSKTGTHIVPDKP